MSAERSAGTDGVVTSIARVDDDANGPRLAQVLDLETILQKMNPTARPDILKATVGAPLTLKPGAVILAADDSLVARAMIEESLNAIGLQFIMTKTGKEAWGQLNAIADHADADGTSVYDRVALVLTDLEMPEMDGFTLTRSIKKSVRFKDMPVLIHSSLSGTTNEEHVRSAGADAYVAKFNAGELGGAQRALL